MQTVRLLSLAERLTRSARVFVFGRGYAVPLLSVVVRDVAYVRIRHGAQARWDDNTNNVMLIRRRAQTHIFTACLALAVLVWSLGRLSITTKPSASGRRAAGDTARTAPVQVALKQGLADGAATPTTCKR